MYTTGSKRCTQRAERTQRENQRMSMRIDLEVLSSFGFIRTTSTSDSECEREQQGCCMRTKREQQGCAAFTSTKEVVFSQVLTAPPARLRVGFAPSHLCSIITCTTSQSTRQPEQPVSQQGEGVRERQSGRNKQKERYRQAGKDRRCRETQKEAARGSER